MNLLITLLNSTLNTLLDSRLPFSDEELDQLQLARDKFDLLLKRNGAL